MAKKKTIKSDGKNTAIVNNAAINENISYNGLVKLKLIHDKKIIKTVNIKNTGTQLLFANMTAALTGGNFNIPKYIAIGAKSKPTSLTDKSLVEEIARVYINNTNTVEYKEIDEENNRVYVGHDAIFSTVIPYTSINGITIRELGLFSDKDYATLLARINLPEGIEISQGMGLMVEWTIRIQNNSN